MQFIPVLFLLFLVIYGICIVVKFVASAVWGKELSVKKYVFEFSKEKFLNGYEYEVENILQNKCSYYKKLTPELQEVFLERVINFIEYKTFRPCAIKNVYLEQKVLISASAIQLTFGLNYYLLDKFVDILVYPSSYHSRLKDEYHKGEVNLGGLIILSYDNFLEGNNNETDGLNLGLHEMAHALKFNELLDEQVDIYFKEHYLIWKETADSEMKSLYEKNNGFLRDYSLTNINEFLAVCAENFFERPAQFRNEMPALYEKMVVLLNQDPLHETNIVVPVQTEPAPQFEFDHDNANLEFESSFQLIDLVKKVIAFLIMSAYLVIVLPLTLKIIVTIAFALTVMYFLSSSKKVLIYDNCVVVKPVLNIFSKPDIYGFESIAFVDLRSRHKQEVSIKYYVERLIKYKTYKISFDDFKRNQFIYRLSEHKIKVYALKEELPDYQELIK